MCGYSTFITPTNFRVCPYRFNMVRRARKDGVERNLYLFVLSFQSMFKRHKFVQIVIAMKYIHE